MDKAATGQFGDVCCHKERSFKKQALIVLSKIVTNKYKEG